MFRFGRSSDGRKIYDHLGVQVWGSGHVYERYIWYFVLSFRADFVQNKAAYHSSALKMESLGNKNN